MTIHPCAACKLLVGVSCCEPSENDDGLWWPLTYAEAKRIAVFSRATIEECLHVLKLSASDMRKIRKEYSKREVEQVVDGYGLFLSPPTRKPCRYLGYSGCLLGKYKPHLCELYPLEKVGRRWIAYDKPDHSCIIQDRARGNVAVVHEMLNIRKGRPDQIMRTWNRDRKTHERDMRRHIINAAKTSDSSSR